MRDDTNDGGQSVAGLDAAPSSAGPAPTIKNAPEKPVQHGWLLTLLSERSTGKVAGIAFTVSFQVFHHVPYADDRRLPSFCLEASMAK